MKIFKTLLASLLFSTAAFAQFGQFGGGGGGGSANATALQGTAVSGTAPNPGQCLVVSAGTVWTPGTCAGGATFQANAVNLTSSATINFQSSAATNGVTITLTNPSAGNVQAGISGTLANAGLANSSIVVTTASPLGGAGTVALGGTLALTCATCGVTGTGLGQFASTTSAQLATVLSDETGSGLAVFGTSPTFLGTPNAGGATQFILPIAAGYASAANGEEGYDTTNKNWHAWGNGVDNLLGIIPVSVTITNGDCAKWVVAAGVTTLGDVGCSGSQTFPAAGIMVSTGSAFGTSLAAPTGTIVGTSDAQTLTGKSIAGSEINSGLVTVTVGGTGVSNPTAHQIPVAEGSSAFAFLPPGSSGLCMMSNGTSADPSFQTCPSGFSNPMTTQGDFLIENATPAPARLAGPTTYAGVPQQLSETSTAGVAGLPTWGPGGVPVDAVSSASPTVALTDRLKLYLTTNSTTSTAVTVPQSGATNFDASFAFVHCNTGTVVATDTPTTSTINGNTTLKLVGQVSGNNPECTFIWGDNTNYTAAEILPTDANGRLQAAGMPAFTGDMTNAAGALATVVGKVNGVTYSSGPSTNTVPVVTSANTITYEAVPNAALANASTTPNGQTCTLGSTCNVNNGAAIHSVALNQGAGQAITGVGPGTTGQILSTTASADPSFNSFSDLSKYDYVVGGGTAQAQTATLAPPLTALTAGVEVKWKPNAANTSGAPTLAVNGLTATAITKCGTAALIANDLITTAIAYAVYDGTQFQLINPQTGICGTSINGTSIPATATLFNMGTPVAGGLAYGLSTTQYSTTSAGTAKQLVISGGASTPTMIDFPDVKSYPAANCVSANPGSAWSTTLGPLCIAGSNNLGGQIPFADASTAQIETEIPADWDSTSQPFVNVFFNSGANTTGTVIFNVAVACTKSDGSITADPAFNTADALATKTMAAATRTWSTSLQLTQVTSGNNCVAGGTMLVKLTRATDTAGSVVQFTKMTITTPRLLTVQAD